jgi:hypothetical protein
MDGRFPGAVALSALFFAVTGCQIGVVVKVSGPATAPLFEIAEEGWGAKVPPVFGEFAVAQQNGDQWSTAWAFSRPHGGCKQATSRVVYGRVPATFVAEQPVHPLEEGKTYQAMVGGCGRTGAVSFKVMNGLVVPS